MDPELVNSITELVKALTLLANATGHAWFAVITLGSLTLVVGVPWWREHKRNQRADTIIEHKEKEILRLADDNRAYREVYLAKMGMPTEALKHDSDDSKSAKSESVKREGKR